MAASRNDGSSMDEFQTKLRKLAETERVDFAELFPPGFMTRHTAYAALEDMLDASGLLAHTSEEAAATLHSEGWDAFVSQTTEFESWAEMQSAAAAEWAGRRPA